MDINDPTSSSGQTKAPIYDPKDCIARVRSRWLYGSATAVSLKHAELFHVGVCLQQRRFFQ
jgi:hypothetical protein